MALLVPPTAVWGAWLFAVISAYAITSTLLREHARTGDIAVGRFWMRRAFRVLPPLAPLLIAAAFLPLPLAHLRWMLPVAAFYLLWPMLLVAIGPRAIAAIADRTTGSLRYHRFLRSRWFGPALALSVLVPPVFAALLVEWCVHRRRGLARTALNEKPAVWAGTVAYGAFLWFTPFMAVFQWWLAIPLTVVAAIATHFLLERPALALREKVRAPQVTVKVVAPRTWPSSV